MYYINLENTGLENFAQVEHMAEAMRRDGYDVEATRNFGIINHDDAVCPVDDINWNKYLEDASEVAVIELSHPNDYDSEKDFVKAVEHFGIEDGIEERILEQAAEIAKRNGGKIL